MIKKKFIVSGNYDEYLEYVYKKNLNISNILTEYIYVNSKKDFGGVLDIEGFYIGTYYKRHDIGEIKDMIKMSKIVYLVNNEYTVEHITKLYNNHVIDYKYHLIVD